MSEAIRDRVARLMQMDKIWEWPGFVLTGVVSLAVAGIVVYFFHVSSYYAFGLAVVVIWLDWRSLRRDRSLRYFNYLVEELETSLKDQITKELHEMSEQLGELKLEVRELKRGGEHLESKVREVARALEELDGKVSEVSNDLSGFSGQFRQFDGDLEAIRSRVDDLEVKG